MVVKCAVVGCLPLTVSCLFLHTTCSLLGSIDFLVPTDVLRVTHPEGCHFMELRVTTQLQSSLFIELPMETHCQSTVFIEVRMVTNFKVCRYMELRMVISL